ncbi:MAG: SUMF1/EgtB/PvdO family nonheme iron enzyme [Nitrospirota bacterium]
MAFFMMGQPALATDGKRVAFVVGIGTYDHLPPHQQLKNPRNDAEGVSKKLTDMGFQVVKAPDLTRSGFNARWQDVLNGLTEDDTFVLFFSGHGVQVDGQNYLLPRDIPHIEYGRQAQLKREAISLDELLADLSTGDRPHPKRSVVILDACRDNPLIPQEFKGGATRGGLAKLPEPNGIFVIYSAGSNKTALDRLSPSDPVKYSVFTRVLLPLMERTDLTIQTLSIELREQVAKLAEDAGHAQQPAYYDGIRGRFCLPGCAMLSEGRPGEPKKHPIASSTLATGSAKNIEDLKRGIVKITAQVEGRTNIGTGFIVRLDKDAAYIVTAAHVVAGDTHPKVEFFTKRNLPVTAEVLGLEGNDEVRGLALLVVRGPENLPKGLTALSLAGATRLTGGELIVVIGFPPNAGPWAIVKGNIVSRQGRDILFSPSIESGHSGGPIFQGGNVVGVVGLGSQSAGRGVTIRSVQDYIEGFGITAQERASAASMATESSPPPAAIAKSEPRPMTQDHEITGKGDAPMMLIPAGEFWMGSPNGVGAPDEHPRHRVYLDAYYMDRFEVTVSRYTESMQSTGRQDPRYWKQVKTGKHSDLPVIGVDWHDAEAYCRWVGKRLPTEAEWEKAARGTDGRTYPWGNNKPTTRLGNFMKKTLANAYDERLAPAESYEEGQSPYGLHHMAGNVWEWTADWYDEHFYAASPQRNPTGPLTGTYKVIRGGSWDDEPVDVRSAYRGKYQPMERYDNIGFRCAQDRPK